MTGLFDRGADDAPPLPVLVVDDEPSICNLLAVVAGKAGAVADVAANLAAARVRLAERHYACVLLDKNLPDGSGVELLAEIAHASPETLVLVITGYANLESAVAALREGAFDYLTKPFDLVQVTHRVELALDRYRMRLELEKRTEHLRRAHAQLAQARAEESRAVLETALLLSRAGEFHDPAAAGHVTRVSRYAGLLARAAGLDAGLVASLLVAAPLHDIGNLGVPESILQKPGPLDEAERARVREHPTIGARILEGSSADVLVLAREVALTHHERWDGTGYPAGLKGKDIPLAGRIVAIVDVWDALTTPRSYRPGVASFGAAMAELGRGAASAFDPGLIEAFAEAGDRVAAILAEERSDPR